MKTISIPYYTSTLDLHVDEANLKAVVTAKMHEYKALLTFYYNYSVYCGEMI